MMRSLSLAVALKEYANVHFVLDIDAHQWQSIVEEKGFTAELLCSGTEIAISQKSEFYGVLVDSYVLALSELFEWKSKYGKLVIIDDFGKAPIFADLVISPSLTIEKEINNVNQINLIGPKYALLSSEYSNHKIVNNYFSNIKTILLSFGFYDSKNLTKLILDALGKTDFQDTVQIAIGSNAPHLNSIKKVVSKYTFNVEIFEDIFGLYELNSKSDLIIGSGGVGLLERMALGKPSITFAASDNQVEQVKWAQSIGATIAFIHNKEFKLTQIIKSLNLVLSDVNTRNIMSKISSNAIDGAGASRVAKVLKSNI